MGFPSVIKGLFKSGSSPAIPTIASATTIEVPSNVSVIRVSGSTAISSIIMADRLPGPRILYIIGAASGTATLVNNNSPSDWNMDLGGSNRDVAATDTIGLLLLENKTWLRLSAQVDN